MKNRYMLSAGFMAIVCVFAVAATASGGATKSGARTLVGRFGARSRVRAGEPLEVAVDTRSLHFFDPETGLGIYDASPTKGAAS